MLSRVKKNNQRVEIFDELRIVLGYKSIKGGRDLQTKCDFFLKIRHIVSLCIYLFLLLSVKSSAVALCH